MGPAALRGRQDPGPRRFTFQSGAASFLRPRPGIAIATPEPRVDAYIQAAAPFAQPLLAWLRQCVHDSCPDIEESIKWRMPFFVYRGRPLAHMAAFKAHCVFALWQGGELAPQDKAGEAMGQFGRITSPADLPARRELQALLQHAAAAIDNAAVVPAARRAVRQPPAMPEDAAAALAAEPGLRERFDALPTSHRREHLEAVLAAKRPDTRARRVALLVEKLAGRS
jgi:uncharacterized protein YdeI (YjbR/CyaY-like superfamily)